MAAVLVTFFGIVIAVNFTMARFATATFGGIVVENSYVASQEFNRWLDEAEAERALGWDALTAWRPDGRLAVALSGVPEGAEVTGVARHPLGRMPDHAFTFVSTGKDQVLSREVLPDGRWLLRLEVVSAGKTWRREEELR
ncbi:FixH family protein [Altericroceibacterium xinjiangense]|uniref:FixH family protein n=1 Tax=Altericroceibacterium xinjiangense TaxID=762261 RepID=UPI001F4937DD|nr:FixH family protein [Altericroceibacterium xinjiangense]